MLPCYVLLDLETTGGNAVRDRITEIAAVRIEHGVEVARWSTLVNPGVPISGFIEQLTGISNALVADAPTFDDVGHQHAVAHRRDRRNLGGLEVDDQQGGVARGQQMIQ